eukprot:11778046-Ditylum_brightwellii.AAC.1
MATITEVDAQVKLRSGINPELHTLNRKEPTDSICQLGLLNNPTGVLTEDYNKRYSTYKKMECENLMSPFPNAILPKLGLNRHMHRAIIHGACLYGGLQMAHFVVEQGYLNIKFLLGHLRENSLVGQHLMILLSQANTVSGSATSYLEEVETLRNYVPLSWIGSIRRFLKYTSSRIKIYQAWPPTLQCEHDKILMDWFEQEKPGTATLDHLNRVHLY